MNTIVALATPPGRSAIGILRLSGQDAWSIAQQLIDNKFKPRAGVVTVKDLRDPFSEKIIDKAVLTFFQEPNSFTGEDVVEMSCHGSPVIVRQLLDLILKLGGCLAEPGEFSFRALANGKINLSQAEAIRDLINARTTAAATQASRQLHGELSSALAPIKSSLVAIIVHLESALEFSEDDLPPLQIQALSSQLRDVIAEVARLAATYEVGHLLRDGVKIAIVGPPNAGKSSLFNGLLGLPRAIVTDIPGTTRDTINEQLSWDGFPVLLTDTAGIRQSQDPLEEIGIERTRTTMAEADLCLVVIDGSKSLEEKDLDNLLLDEKAKQILVLNKLDLPSFKDCVIELGQKVRQVKVSALTGEGLDELRTAILENFGGIDSEDAGLLVTNARHNDLLRRTETHLREAAILLDEKASEELILIGLHNALRFLDEITGETTAEDILSEIFSTFCIGK